MSGVQITARSQTGLVFALYALPLVPPGSPAVYETGYLRSA
jgi:hypothetical protein